MTEDLMKKLKRDLKKVSVNGLARKLLIPAPTLWRIVTGRSPGSLKTWNRIEECYKVIDRPG